MRISNVVQKREVSGVPIVGREDLLKAIDLYASDPPSSNLSSVRIPNRTSRIVRNKANEFSSIDDKDTFLRRLKDRIQDELNRDRLVFKDFSFSSVVEPFNGMSLAVRALGLKKELFVLKLTRCGDESLEKKLAKMHGVERALNSIDVDAYLERDGDDVRIDFEELVRALDSVEGLNTSTLHGEAVLAEITDFGRREDKFSLGNYDFPPANGLVTKMSFYSIPQDYPLSLNAHTLHINGSTLVAPLEENYFPRIQFQITGGTSDLGFLGEPITDGERKVTATNLGNSIESVFKQMLPVSVAKEKESGPRKNWLVRMLSSLS